MRAPPLSFRPITGAPTFIAMSMTLQIFCACRSLSEPPNTVKSWPKTKTRRPLIVPDPVTTPSPGTFCVCMPKSTQLCSTYMSSSSNEPSSSSTSRSRAVSLPLVCCAAMRFSPPPSRACSRRRSSSWIVVAMRGSYSQVGRETTNRASSLRGAKRRSNPAGVPRRLCGQRPSNLGGRALFWRKAITADLKSSVPPASRWAMRSAASASASGSCSASRARLAQQAVGDGRALGQAGGEGDGFARQVLVVDDAGDHAPVERLLGRRCARRASSFPSPGRGRRGAAAARSRRRRGSGRY